MRSLHFLLVITVGFLASLAVSVASDSGTPTVNTVQNNNYESRLLRGGGAAKVHTSNENEERATVGYGVNQASDKAVTKKLLTDLLDMDMLVKTVKERFLNMPSKMKDFELVSHPNWKALVKYQRMKYEKKIGVLPYATIDGVQLTKEKTQEKLLKWLAVKKPVDSVAKKLNVRSVPKRPQLPQQNWRAYRMYEKWFAADSNIKINEEGYSKFGTGYHTEEKTKEVLLWWVINEVPIKDVLKIFKLTGLSASKMAEHENFPALLKYVEYTLRWKVLKAIMAANDKLARAKRVNAE